MFESKLLGTHGELLRLRSMRSEVIAKNLANSNTPNFKAMDFSIKDSLSQESIGKPSKTNAMHLGFDAGKSMAIEYQYRIPFQQSLDGNTVETDQEIIQLTENSIKYQFSLNYISDKIKQATGILKDI